MSPLSDWFVRGVFGMLRRIFSWFFVTLDLSNRIQWLFRLDIGLPDTEITCEGTRQPMYLFADVIIAAPIIAQLAHKRVHSLRVFGRFDRAAPCGLGAT